MNLLLLGNDPAYQEFKKQLGANALIISPGDLIKNENIQKDFDYLYSAESDNLLGIKIKIPYFYDIKFHLKHNIFQIFSKYYSQLQGAKAVFVSDKKLNKYSEWLELNTLWINQGITLPYFKPKKFLTPPLHIGYIFNNLPSYEIVKNMWLSKKANWVLHLYGCEGLKDTQVHSSKEDLYENCQILINLDLESSTLDIFPNKDCLEAMARGCVLVSSNNQGNYNHILFDKVHYFKLDFIDSNTLLDTIRYVDKRREKLDRVSGLGFNLLKKYFNLPSVVKQKIDIIKNQFIF